MHVANLLGSLLRIPHHEIVKPALPYLTGHNFTVLSQEFMHKPLLEHLHDSRRIAFRRFANKQVDMLRHYDIPSDNKFVALTDLFKHGEKQISTIWRTENG